MLIRSYVSSLIDNFNSSLLRIAGLVMLLIFNLGFSYKKFQDMQAQLDLQQGQIQQLRDLDVKTNMEWMKQTLERMEGKIDRLTRR